MRGRKEWNMRRLFEKGLSIVFSLVMAMTMIVAVPNQVKAATTITLNFLDMTSEAGTATLTSDFNFTLQAAQYQEKQLQDNGNILGDEYCWTDAQAAIDTGYTELRFYATWLGPLAFTSAPTTGLTSVTVTFPLPSGYTRADGTEARLMYALTGDGLYGKVNVAPLTVTDTTITFEVPAALSSWSQDAYMIENHFFVEYKKHVHEWDDGVVTTSPTEKAEGVKTYTCSGCGETKTEAIAKLGTSVTLSTKSDAKYELAEVNKDGSVEVAYSGTTNKKATSVTVPDTVVLADGTKATVTEIADGTFKKNKKMTKLTVGKNVETIGADACNGCSKLTTVNIKSKKLTKVDKGAFKNCSKLTKTTLPSSVKEIGKEAYAGDSKLTSLEIKSTKLKKIGKNAFKNTSKKAVAKVPKKQATKYTKLLQNAGFKGTVKKK
ncbi:MAG: leucine-rich repeat domain-containing protein [Lachnospiraceae bacterium]|nr:leucine-rich repeat domain-containing protein [Lachnospiraceae bacterium]